MNKENFFKISVIGQGFAGFPMSVVLANSKTFLKLKNFHVLGVEKNNKAGNIIKDKINKGILPFDNNDKKLKFKFKKAIKKNYSVTTNINDIIDSNVVIISINFDFKNKNTIINIKKIFQELVKIIDNKTLILIESTLPPGTCENIIVPILIKKISINKLKLSYSYERVTPGENYYSSIENSFRCYSGINNISKIYCENFLKGFINYRKYPFSKLPRLRDCEAAKIIENSFRAMNIAFIDEWMKYSNKIDLNINQILESIRKRPTHKNIMSPGIGVGGYCLTKDPSFGRVSSKYIFKNNVKFPLSELTQKINLNMAKTSIEFIKKKIKIKKNKFLILGATYKEDIEDFRESPSLKLAKEIIKIGGKVEFYDPYIKNVKFENFQVRKKIYKNKINNILITVKHKKFKSIKFSKFKNKKIFDLCNFFQVKQNNKNYFYLGEK